MKNFLHIRDIPLKDLKKIISDAKNRKSKRKKLNTLDPDKDSPLKGKILLQMFEKSSLRTRLSFYLAIKQLGGGSLCRIKVHSVFQQTVLNFLLVSYQ